MERKYLFAFIYDKKDCLFRDIISDESPIEYLPSHKVFQSAIANFFESCVLSYQINSKVIVPFQSVLYNLENYNYEKNIEYYLIIPNSSIAKLSFEYLMRFKQRHNNVMLLALLVDSIHGHSIQMNLVRDKLNRAIWDYILTYDKYDAEEFGYKWIGYAYYSAHNEVRASSIKSDLFCISSPKGRNKEYAEIYNFLSSKGIDCNFRLFTHAKDKYVSGTNILYMHNFMNYDDVVGEIKSSNCILEVLQPGQRMQTIRYMEAIVYNKKLLTNNPDIKNMPYYDGRYMKVYNNIEDIDYKWIGERDTIDYGYNGDFSPVNLINTINKFE